MASLARHAATHWRLAAAVVTVGLAITVVFSLVYFQPQDLFINHSVSQARPTEAVVIREGSFHSGEPPPPASLSCSASRRPDHPAAGAVPDLQRPGGARLAECSRARRCERHRRR